MALTETQKKKIEEEESYRAEVKGKLSKKKKGIGVGGWILIILASPFILIGLLVGYINSSSPSPANTTTERTQEQNVEAVNGSYESYDGNSYNYKIIYKQNEGRYAAVFSPFIPRDDKNLVEAALKVFKTTYGDNAKIDPQPLVKEKDGVNVITFKGDAGDYYILPIKEDTGEINTLLFWKE